MALDFERVRKLFGEFDFASLFVEELGWSHPKAHPARTIALDSRTFTAISIAQLSGVVVLEISSADGEIPDAKTKAAVHRDIAKLHLENLLIFVDRERSRSVWYWVKREEGKEIPRPHEFVRGQPGDLFLSKVAPLLFEIEDFEKGEPAVVEVARRLRVGLDVEKVTKRFYTDFQKQHLSFLDLITGIPDERQRRWYASVLLNRLMFVWFLQKKGFVDGGNLDYLREKLDESRKRGSDRFFRDLLTLLFFEGFAKPAEERSPEARERLGDIRYLNGGLFLPHAIELAHPNLDVPDRAFENLFALFQHYSWNLNDTPGGDSNEINPDVLGYIFEKYINQKAFGAYYTRTEITTYLCERTIHRLVLDAVNMTEEEKKLNLPGKKYDFKTIGDLILNLDAELCRKLFLQVLPRLTILDPACGSGAFLVAAMKTLMKIYGAAAGQGKFVGDRDFQRQIAAIEKEHPNLDYYIKKSIITNNLYGLDIMEEAVEIAKLRLFLALVSSAHSVDQLEPLPNIDFNLLPGNSLVGLMRVDAHEFEEKQGALFRQRGKNISAIRRRYRELVDEKNRKVQVYRQSAVFSEDLRSLRDDIEKVRHEAAGPLNEITLDKFRDLGIKYEAATWDAAKKREGRGIKRQLEIADIEDLQPFHWGYEFDEIMNQRGGFDAIITNPPWESVVGSAKEFFSDHADISKNKMDIKDFEKELERLLRDPKTMEEWLAYHSRFNHQRAYFGLDPEYENQMSIIGGKRQRSDINLYKLFLERCFRLLRDGGECGIVLPGSLYADVGAKRLREMLFSSTEITGLFGFENRKLIFEGVDSRFKFIVLTFKKGGATTAFPTAFMRHDVQDLSGFPAQGAIPMPLDLVRRLSPDSLSLQELRSPRDVAIVEKMIAFRMLRERLDGSWNVELHRELHMTDDAHLFEKRSLPGMLPLYEGRMIHHFNAFYSEPRFFINEKKGRTALRSTRGHATARLEYEEYRIAFRDVARNTDARTMIATILPRRVFAGHTLYLCASISMQELLYLTCVFGSFVFDWFMRLKVSAHVNPSYVYQSPVPRVQVADVVFEQLALRAAKLICTRPEFDDLAAEVKLPPGSGVTDPAQRSVIQSEIDAIVAHLYGLTEDDLRHILAAFPLVGEARKQQVIEAYKQWTPPTASPLRDLIAAGESSRLEFKSSARWGYKQNQVHKELEFEITSTVASFMNSEGGTLLIGVDDSGKILGLDRDYQTMSHRPNADGYENWLMTKIIDSAGKDRSRLVRVSFHTIDSKQICRVDVERSPRPVFIPDAQGNERLYIRIGNSTRALSVSEALEYCREHFASRVEQATVEGEPRHVAPEESAPVQPTTHNETQSRLPIASAPRSSERSFPDVGLFKKKNMPATVAEAQEEDDPSRRRLVDQLDIEDALAAIRDVVSVNEGIDREEAIREIGHRLGADRVGSRTRDFIESAINAAIRRSIIESERGLLRPRCQSVDDYKRDELKAVLKAVVGRTWTDEEEAIRSAARYLGFQRTGSRIQKAFKSAINGAIRQDLAERDGSRIRFRLQ